MPDDAFYYFEIARHIVQGSGSTADGIAPTNGFHPLWMLVLVIIDWIFGSGGDLPIHVALSVTAVMDLVTAVLIYRIVVQAVQWQAAALLAAAIYFLNPYSVLASLDGLETTISLLFFALSIWWYERVKRVGSDRWWRWAIMGCLLGLLMLARTDYVLFVLALNADVILRLKPIGQKVRALFIQNFVALLALGPWVIWNLARFGSIMQVSGEAYPYYLHAAKLAEWGSYLSVGFLRQELVMAGMLAAHLATLSGLGKALPLAIILVAATIALDRQTTRRDECLALMGKFGYVAVGALAPVAVNGLWRWMILPWYFAPWAVVVAIYSGLVLTYLGSYVRQVPYVVAALVFVWYGFQYVGVDRVGVYENQIASVSAAMPAIEEVCQHEKIIGITDSGYYSYYAPCTVVNLDGVVNNQAFRALEHGTLVDYLQENGIHYVMLNPIVYSMIPDKGRLLRQGMFWKVLPKSSG